jgi:hypothetical protein
MAKDKKSFLLHIDLLPTVEKLPDNKAGRLFKMILEYVNDKNPQTEDLLIQVAFEPIKQQLKRSLKKWEETLQKRSEAGKAGMAKRWHSEESITPDNTVKKPITKITDSVSVNGSVSVNVSDNKYRRAFAAPSLEDVRKYFAENEYSVGAADKAFAYYNEAGWVDSKGNKVRNWKQKMISVWFKPENKIKLDGRISQFSENQW